MIKAPIPENEARRLATLRAYHVLDSMPELEFDEITELAAAICRTPISLISLVDTNRQWFKSRRGLDAGETSRDYAFCAHAILDSGTMIVPDAHLDARFFDNPLVTSAPHVRFYAGAPLTVPSGERLGTLCVIDREPRTLSAEQIRAIELLARHVASRLEMRRQIAELERSAPEIRSAAALLGDDRFRILSDAAPVGIYETDVDGLCVYTNPAWQKIAGLTFAESLGHGWSRAIHPDDRDRVFAEWQQAVFEKREFELEYRFRTPEGKVSIIDSRARAIISPAGEIIGYVGTMSDITRRRQAENALRAKEQQLQRVIEGSTDGFWDWDLVTGAVEFSARWAEMLGYELDEIEPHVRSWENLVHPDDVSGVQRVLNEHFEGRLPHYETEHRVRTKSGAWKWILDRGKVTARAEDGTPLRMAGTHSDIDERKRAEDALDRFFNLSLDLLGIADTKGQFKRINPAFEETFGYSNAEMLGRPFLEFVHPDDRARTLSELSRLAAGGVTFRFENRYICRDGSVKWIAWTARPFVEEGLIYTAGRDITAERAAAEVIAASEARYRDLFENASDMIQSVDVEGRFRLVNRAWLETLGYTKEEAEALTIFDVIDSVYLPHCREMLQRVLTGESVPKLVVGFRTKTGELRILEGTVSCRFEDDKPVATRGIFRDVTEQKKAEDELRARESALRSIIENSLSGIVTFDAEGLIETLNPAAERILGYRSPELAGVSASALVVAAPAELNLLNAETLRQTLGRTTEWQVRRADGRFIQIELALFEFETTHGRQLAADIQDISARREVERMKREFVATVSHELRTPLTSIRGSLDLLQGRVLGELTPAAHELVTIAQRNTTRLIGLINDILDLERLDNGKLELQIEHIGVDALFRDAVDAVTAMADAAAIGIDQQIEPLTVAVDSHRLVQVLVNLLSNAIKFSPPGARVRLSAMQDADRVVIEVSDHGRGIPAQHLDRIFDRFQQVEASDSRRKGGSGLGLAISRALVELHHGTIRVSSEEGKGSTFSIRLPAVPRAVTPGDRVAGVFVPLDGALPAVEQMLAEEGYIVSRLLTPGEVLAAVRSGHLSILIMSLDAQPAATLLLSQVRAADTRGDTPVIVLASSSQSIEWLSDNLTVFLSGAGDLDLLHAIRKFAGETANNDVLIIEDDEALLSILRRQLESEGMQVRTATTGGAAIAMIRRAAPTLIVLDVRLPDIDGFDVVSMLHREERFRRLPLLVYSGLSLGSRERERLTLGPTRFLTKATSDDAAFRKLVGELIRSVRAEHAP